MKKVISLVAMVTLVFGLLAGCGNASKQTENTDDANKAGTSATPEASAETPQPPTVKAPADTKVVFLTLSLEGEYFVILKDELEKHYKGAGYQFEAYSADMDPLKQLEQLENAAANKADLIVIWPVEPNALTDACQRAMDKGTKIFAFAQDTVARNCFRGTDDTVVGSTIADLALDWAEKTFPDAEDGSINAIVLGSVDTANNTTRFEAIQKELGKNSKVKILEAVAIESSTVAGQAAAENMFQKYKNIDMFVCAAGEVATGVMSYATSESSPIKDISKFGVAGSEMSKELANYMKDGIYVGSALNGGNIVDNMQKLYDQSVKILNGEEYDEVFPVDVAAVKSDNLADFGY